MSTEWGDLRVDPGFSSGSSTGRSRSAARAGDRDGPGAWAEDLETSIYGEQDWTLPGQEERPASCGNWFPREFCEDCGEVHFQESACRGRGCPSCWWQWSRQRAGKIARRLGSARLAADENADKRAVHAVVSAPEGEIQSKQQFYDGFKKAYEIARDHGVRGGVVVPHGYRPTDEVKREWRRNQKEEYSGGIWSWIRENERHWRDQTYWSPHFHILGLGRYEEVEAGEDRDDGWLFRKLRTLERFTLTDESGYQDMIGTARYLLSHLTYEQDAGKQSLRWFGELAPASFSPEEELSEGRLNALERRIEELLGQLREEAVEDPGETEQCEREDCNGQLVPIWDAGQALMRREWCKSISDDRERRLLRAFEWAIGEAKPPPGLKNPRTEAEARESLEALL